MKRVALLPGEWQPIDFFPLNYIMGHLFLWCERNLHRKNPFNRNPSSLRNAGWVSLKVMRGEKVHVI
jgi:hypothetical protein